jgi:hypothetical protein
MGEPFTKLTRITNRAKQVDKGRWLSSISPRRVPQQSASHVIGFVSDSRVGKDSKCYWLLILLPREFKSNPSIDIGSKVWLDLGRYTREVLAIQDTRYFVLSFNFYGSLIRIWEFD